MKNFTRMSLVLFIVCGAAAGALAFVNQVTKPKIAEQARLEKELALKEVFPKAAEFKETIPDRLWEAYGDGEMKGSVILTTTQGYSGNVDIIFGVNPDGSLSGIKILRQSETPGLGSKIADGAFLSQFLGGTPETIALKKDDPAKGSVDAISAATISSRTVTNAVRNTLDSFLKGELQ